MRRSFGWLAQLGLMLFGILLAFLLMEGGLRVLYRFKEGGEFNARAFRARLHANSLWASADAADQGCSWVDTLYPHPSFGFIQHDVPPCGWKTNNIGTFGQNLPLEKPRDKYVILVLGGSVAQILASGRPTQERNPIEDYLNAHYSAPGGRSFLVINGAVGSWKQPNQLYFLSSLVDRVDAFVSLEGANEAIMIRGNTGLERPFPVYLSVARLPGSPWLEASVVRWFRYQVITSWLKDSYLSLQLLSWASQFIEKQRTTVGLSSPFIERYFEGLAPYDQYEAADYKTKKYLLYLRSIAAVSREHGLRGMVFLQPIATLFKPLANEEKKIGSVVPTELYLKVEKAILTNQPKGLPVRSLLRLFQSETRPVYVDDMHPGIDPENHSLGYDSMAQAMADSIAKEWGFRPKAAARPSALPASR